MTAPLIIEVEVAGLPVQVETTTTSAIVSAGPPVAVLVAVPGQPGEPGPPGEGVVVMGEIPSGVLDGANTVFGTGNAFLPDSTGVYLNGLRLVRGPHYIETTSQSVTLDEAPSAVDILTIDYTVAG